MADEEHRASGGEPADGGGDLGLGGPVQRGRRFVEQQQRTVGEEVVVSADIFTDERTGHSYYRADVAIDDHVLAELDGRRLVPGMPVEAFIATEDRTTLGYIVKPMADYFNRAFRER